VTDRAGLEEATSECYTRISQSFERLLSGTYSENRSLLKGAVTYCTQVGQIRNDALRETRLRSEFADSLDGQCAIEAPSHAPDAADSQAT
jgi:hypothetical protein